MLRAKSQRLEEKFCKTLISCYFRSVIYHTLSLNHTTQPLTKRSTSSPFLWVLVSTLNLEKDALCPIISPCITYSSFKIFVSIFTTLFCSTHHLISLAVHLHFKCYSEAWFRDLRLEGRLIKKLPWVFLGWGWP